ncbi:MAG: purine-nucleoside phosphorylase [Chlorobiota bacterium]|nr:purine-nucleoside phosphorylase [Chlorobiota bacterium]QQS67272.1 MAG: purine-nucleoside phosphorylase [Chlorobiota bacterium]
MNLKERINDARDTIKSIVNSKNKSEFLNVECGIILGTGLGGLVDEIEDNFQIEYTDIPHFATSTVESHKGRLIFGKLSEKYVVVMQGRFHFYEGYTMDQITFPIRVMKSLGAQTLIVSNACGGMNPLYRSGDIMIIDDHINLLNSNPLIGFNDDSLGPRFPDMSEPYSKELIEIAKEVAIENRIKTHQGVFVSVPGPNLETRAEYRYLRTIGADVVGMSTVPEVIVANHSSMRVLGLSIITDECFPDNLSPVNVEEIISAASKAEPQMTTIIKGTLYKI